MLGSALYFPRIDIDDPVWLRSAILFWDDIQTIVPSEVERPYRNPDTQVCHAEGYLKPLVCDLHEDLIDDLGRTILRHLDKDADIVSAAMNSNNEFFQSAIRGSDIGNQIKEALGDAGMYPKKFSRQVRERMLHLGLSQVRHGKMSPGLRRALEDLAIARVHPHKLSRALRSFEEELPFITDDDQKWLLVDSRFASSYMSALASKLSKKLDLSPLTSSEREQSAAFSFMFDDMIDYTGNGAQGAMVGLVMRGLRVDPSVPVQKLIQFRRDREDQYKDCAGKILELSDKLSGAGDSDGRDFLESAKESYVRNIEPSLRSLRRELSNQAIATTWGGAYRALSISIPASGTLAYLTGLNGTALLGAAAALAAADIGIQGYLAGRKARSSNPFSYLHDVRNNFGLPEWVD